MITQEQADWALYIPVAISDAFDDIGVKISVRVEPDIDPLFLKTLVNAKIGLWEKHHRVCLRLKSIAKTIDLADDGTIQIIFTFEELKGVNNANIKEANATQLLSD